MGDKRYKLDVGSEVRSSFEQWFIIGNETVCNLELKSLPSRRVYVWIRMVGLNRWISVKNKRF